MGALVAGNIDNLLIQITITTNGNQKKFKDSGFFVYLWFTEWRHSCRDNDIFNTGYFILNLP